MKFVNIHMSTVIISSYLTPLLLHIDANNVTVGLFGCALWPVRVADERVLAVFENDRIRRILCIYRTVELRCRLLSSSKEGSVGLATARDALRMILSGASFCLYRLALGQLKTLRELQDFACT